MAETPDNQTQRTRGRLKVFLGYAAGVGKTYTMLCEARRRRGDSGQDIVIGAVETHGRKETAAQIGDLETVPPRSYEYRGAYFDEMDVERIIRRHPLWVIVDELAHLNVPGGHNARRYQDVLDLLDAGISVLTAVNVQHLESLNDSVLQIAGVKVRETVPDSFLRQADELVDVDLTPRALIHRLERGEIYPADKVPVALANFFTEGTLSAMRELALREVAGHVDRTVQTYRAQHGISLPWQTAERVMVCISPDHPSDRMLRRGWRVAARLGLDIVGVYVEKQGLAERERKVFETDLKLAADLGIRVEKLTGPDVAAALAHYAWDNQVTEIVIGHSARSKWQEITLGSVAHDLIRQVRGIDVLVIAHPEQRA